MPRTTHSEKKCARILFYLVCSPQPQSLGGGWDLKFCRKKDDIIIKAVLSGSPEGVTVFRVVLLRFAAITLNKSFILLYFLSWHLLIFWVQTLQIFFLLWSLKTEFSELLPLFLTRVRATLLSEPLQAFWAFFFLCAGITNPLAAQVSCVGYSNCRPALLRLRTQNWLPCLWVCSSGWS